LAFGGLVGRSSATKHCVFLGNKFYSGFLFFETTSPCGGLHTV
jgi:hypothetical protein